MLNVPSYLFFHRILQGLKRENVSFGIIKYDINVDSQKQYKTNPPHIMETAITFFLSVSRLLCTPRMNKDLKVKAKLSKIVHLSSFGYFSNKKEINTLTHEIYNRKNDSEKK